MSDLCEKHKTEILEAADQYFCGKTSSQDVTQKLSECFNKALADGTAHELLKALQKTPFGKPNVTLHDDNGREILEFRNSFWEHATERRSFSKLDVALDEKNKTVAISEQQMFQFEPPDWWKTLAEATRPPAIITNPELYPPFK